MWVPFDDPEHMDVLVMAQHNQEIDRVKALRRRVQNSSPDAAVIPLVRVAVRDLASFARRLTWYLRHGAKSIRPDGFVPIQTILMELEPELSAGGVAIDTVLEICEMMRENCSFAPTKVIQSPLLILSSS